MTWLTWPFRLLGFAFWYGWQLIASNLAVLKDNLTPGQDSMPGIAAYDTRCRNEAEVTLLASLITLTPGTLTLGLNTDTDVSEGRPSGHGRTRESAEDVHPEGTVGAAVGNRPRTLFVHSLYSGDADAVRREIEEMETRMLHGIRREGAGA